MNRKKIALIAMKLAEMAFDKQESFGEDILLNPSIGWRAACYYALIFSIKNTREDIGWHEEYNQWKISHRLRANLSSAKKSQLCLIQLEGEKIGQMHLNIKVRFSENNTTYDESVTLQASDFSDILWTPSEIFSRTILQNAEEAASIFNLIADNFAPSIQKINIDENIASYQKYHAFLETLNTTREQYKKGDKAYKSFIESLLAAGLFYLPFGKNHFQGFISFRALFENLQCEGTMVKDHVLPRKRAAKILLDMKTINWSVVDFVKWYQKNMQFMLVTSAENRALINYYLRHENYEEALNHYNIIKLPNIGSFKSLIEVNEFIRYLNERNIVPLDAIEANEALEQFRNQRNR
jgi:hypothetical protein